MFPNRTFYGNELDELVAESCDEYTVSVTAATNDKILPPRLNILNFRLSTVQEMMRLTRQIVLYIIAK